MTPQLDRCVWIGPCSTSNQSWTPGLEVETSPKVSETRLPRDEFSKGRSWKEILVEYQRQDRKFSTVRRHALDALHPDGITYLYTTQQPRRDQPKSSLYFATACRARSWAVKNSNKKSSCQNFRFFVTGTFFFSSSSLLSRARLLSALSCDVSLAGGGDTDKFEIRGPLFSGLLSPGRFVERAPT